MTCKLKMQQKVRNRAQLSQHVENESSKNEGREMTAGMLGHAVPMFHDSIAESS